MLGSEGVGSSVVVPSVQLRAEEASHLSPYPIFGCAQHDWWPKVQGGAFQKPRSVLFYELVEDCAPPPVNKLFLQQDPKTTNAQSAEITGEGTEGGA